MSEADDRAAAVRAYIDRSMAALPQLEIERFVCLCQAHLSGAIVEAMGDRAGEVHRRLVQSSVDDGNE